MIIFTYFILLLKDDRCNTEDIKYSSFNPFWILEIGLEIIRRKYKDWGEHIIYFEITNILLYLAISLRSFLTHTHFYYDLILLNTIKIAKSLSKE